MKARIVDLSEYRRLHRPPPRAPASAQPSRAEPHYYCLRCDTDTFKLSAGGAVHCAQCGARMRNLAIGEKPSGDRLPSDSPPSDTQ